jgi:hypothetical protein
MKTFHIKTVAILTLLICFFIPNLAFISVTQASPQKGDRGGGGGDRGSGDRGGGGGGGDRGGNRDRGGEGRAPSPSPRESPSPDRRGPDNKPPQVIILKEKERRTSVDKISSPID